MSVTDTKLTFALGGGRMRDASLELLRQAGLEIGSFENSRSLKFEFGNITILQVKDPDVPVYVDLGVADCGVVGKDWILESARDVYEPLDLGFGRTRFSLIRLPGGNANGGERLNRIATKYPRIAAKYLSERGLTADIVRLNGKIELAALTGLADAVIDLVETGQTLRDNGLSESEVFLHSSARLIVNRASLKLKAQTLRPLIHRMGELVGSKMLEVSSVWSQP
jgi:ATP phosphoribosyltransferase